MPRQSKAVGVLEVCTISIKMITPPHELVHFFAAEYDDMSRRSAGGGVEDEVIEVIEMPFPQALAMVRDGRICDGKTIMLLQQAQLRGWLTAAE